MGIRDVSFLKMTAPRANDEDDVRVASNDFRRQGFGAGRVLLSAVTFDLEVLSLDLSQPPKLSE